MKKSFAVVIAFIALMFGLSVVPANAATAVVTSCGSTHTSAYWDVTHEFAYLTGPAGRNPTFCLRSMTGLNRLVFQSDGNLVVYSGTVSGGSPLWNTHTSGRGATQLRFQSDGNVVIYAGSTPIWNTGTFSTCSGVTFSFAPAKHWILDQKYGSCLFGGGDDVRYVGSW